MSVVAGCGIHNCGVDTSKHDGVHTFYLEENAKVHSIERHYGEGKTATENIMNPQTIVPLKEGAHMEMDDTDQRNRFHGSCDEGDLAKTHH